MEGLIQDLRYAARMLAKSPGFTAVAVLTLALGIGSTTAIFSVVDAVLLLPLPFAAPDRLVAVWGTDSLRGESHAAASYPDFFDFRAQNKVFQDMSMFSVRSSTLTGRGEAAHLPSAVVSPELFSVLGVSPKLGRTFLAEEERPGGAAGLPVILSETLWKSQFGADPNIVGQHLVLDGRPFYVVGVMPASFQFPIQGDPVQLWMTSAVDALTTDGTPPMTTERGAHYLEIIARLKPSITLAEARASMQVIADGLAKQYPDTDAHRGVSIVPELEDLVGNVRPALLLLLAAVGCVLLIASANIANLLLARATARQREIAIREALGAGRWRVIRQLFTESLLLAGLGGVCGLLLAMWGTDLLIRWSPIDIPRVAQASVDGRVPGFTFLVSVLTGLIFGLAPAFHLSQADLAENLKEAGRSSTSGTRHLRLRSLLVVTEMMLALVLLIGAGLLIQSLVHLQEVNPGFDPHGVLAFSVDIPATQYAKPQQVADFFRELLDKIRMLPGVKDASAVTPLPLSRHNYRVIFDIEGHPVAESDQPVTDFRVINLDYFRTMHIPLTQGREFKAGDTLDSLPVVIINEALAQQYFPNESPIGRRIRPGISVDTSGSRMREIVGVVGNVRHSSLRQTPGPECYLPHSQIPFESMSIVVSGEEDPLSLAPAVRQAVTSLDTDVPVYNVRTMDQYVSASVAQSRFSSLLLGIFAGVALILTVVGIYGVISYSVAQRTHEFGVRIALGAQQDDILRLVVNQGLRLTLAGVGLGLMASLLATRLMATLLFGVTATDLATYAGVAAVLSGVALAAGYFPARRATRADPMVALRYE